MSVAEVERTVETIANAKGMAMFEDLGIQMNHHSTLISYLEKLVWVLCGHFGKAGAQYVPAYLQNIAVRSKLPQKPGSAGTHHWWDGALQCHCRRNPDGPPRSLPRHAGGVGQSRSLAG